MTDTRVFLLRLQDGSRVLVSTVSDAPERLLRALHPGCSFEELGTRKPKEDQDDQG